MAYFRSFVFGVEDSLVSTVGLLSGIAMAGVPRGTVFLTGVVLIFVEAFSMAAGSFLSEYTAEEYASKSDASTNRPFGVGTVMFFSYLVAGFIPLLPYLFFDVRAALGISIAGSLAALFILGVVGAKFSRRSVLKRGFRMLVIGGAAIMLGVVAGIIINAL